MQRLFALPICVPGTLTANFAYRFQAPFNLQLVKVSAACDASTSFVLDVGTAADSDAYLDGKTVTGAAATSTEYTRSDFVNGEYPKIADGDEVHVTVDYDGGGGTDGAGVSITLWLTEG